VRIGAELHTRGAALRLHAPDLLHEVGREPYDHRECKRIAAGDQAEGLLHRRRRHRLLCGVAGGGAEGEAASGSGGTVRRRRRREGAAVGGAAAELGGGAAVHVGIAVALFLPPRCLMMMMERTTMR